MFASMIHLAFKNVEENVSQSLTFLSKERYFFHNRLKAVNKSKGAIF